MKAFWSIAVLVGLSSVGCVEQLEPQAGEFFSESNVGVASIALSNVPSQVRCLRVSARPITGGPEVTHNASIPAGKASFTTVMSGVPLGSIQFTAWAYHVDCPAIVATTVAQWQSPATSAQLRADRAPDVALTLYPARSPEIQASFQPDIEQLAQCGLAMIGIDSRSGVHSTGIAEVATAAGSIAAPTDIACGPYFACAVGKNAAQTPTVFCWGINVNSFPLNVQSTTPWAPGVSASSVDVGYGTACAITLDGNVRCWGSNADGLLVPTAPTNAFMAPATPPGITVQAPDLTWQQVAVGGTVACALASTGQIRCWGQHAQGELGSSTARTHAVVFREGVTNGTIKLAASTMGMYALRANGQIARWGEGIMTPTLVSGISDAVDIAAGWGSACALRANGEVVCWGRGESGQHGDGLAESNRAAPSGKVSFKAGTAPVISITGDDASFCAAHADGQVNCWGENSGGNLGDGTTNTAFEPVLAERWDTRIDYPDVLTQ